MVHRKKLFTLCIVCRGDQVLLGMKKRGFGQGKWNGFGGKVEARESIEKAMKRELKEEIGIIPRSFEKKALFEFHFKDNPEYLEVHVFYIPSFEGEPKETEEMRPQWFSKEKLPFESMWPDDKHWLPLFLEGKTLRGRFSFGDDDVLIDYTLKEGDFTFGS
ncbi:8-oxo-dGTP diphosphatase [Patescibacteria group bacterium]|nr:8-oxo-dGTP diphosphatase [Patescibacteria group bacterium]